MSRQISYKAPSRLVIDTTTDERQDDTDRGTLWTTTEVELLLSMYGLFTSRECAEVLRRSELSVRLKIHRLRRYEKTGSVSLARAKPFSRPTIRECVSVKQEAGSQRLRHVRQCQGCGGLVLKRAGAQYCSNACRQRAYRHGKSKTAA